MKRYILTVDSDASLDELMEVLGSLHGFQKTGRTALKYTPPRIEEVEKAISQYKEDQKLIPGCEVMGHYFQDEVEKDGNRISRCTECGEPEFPS
jgi:hypothetical protein